MSRAPKFIVWQAKDGWRWRLVAGNNRIIATGESHPRERDAYRAIQTVCKAAGLAQIQVEA